MNVESLVDPPERFYMPKVKPSPKKRGRPRKPVPTEPIVKIPKPKKEPVPKPKKEPVPKSPDHTAKLRSMLRTKYVDKGLCWNLHKSPIDARSKSRCTECMEINRQGYHLRMQRNWQERYLTKECLTVIDDDEIESVAAA
jgi:hypothetical protein